MKVVAALLGFLTTSRLVPSGLLRHEKFLPSNSFRSFAILGYTPLFQHTSPIRIQICLPHPSVVRRGTCGNIHPCTPRLQLGSVCSHHRPNRNDHWRLRIKKGGTYLNSNVRGMLKRAGGVSYFQKLLSFPYVFNNNTDAKPFATEFQKW